jgi:serine/threonine protein kinase
MSLEGIRLGQYFLLRLLGSGGMGDVYLAEDPRINQQVAVKVIRSELSTYPDSESTQGALRLFQREARAIAMLDHPHILPLFSYGEEPVQGMTLTYMVMPYRSEGSFAAWLQQQAQSGHLLPLEDVGYFIEQAADALQYAHNQHVVHQDIKPSNFLLRANLENPKRPDLLLADFGIATLSGATITGSHTIRGTPVYMAPEQWEGYPLPATDQYALAILTYELLTGRPPYIGRQEQVMYQHFNVQPQPPGQLNSRLTPDIDSVVLSALSKKPTERFQSITAFARALQEAIPNDQAITFIKPIQYEAPRIEKTISAAPFIASTDVISSGYRRKISPWALRSLVLALVVIAASFGFWFLHGISPTSMNSTKTFTTSHVTNTNQIHHGSDATRPVPTNASGTPIPNSAQGNTSSVPSTTDPYPPYTGTLALNDPMLENSASNWQLYSDQYGSCAFADNGYDIDYTRANYFLFCTAQNTDFSNFVYQVHMTFLQGDTGGIVFRVNAAATQYYYFHISTNGFYSLDLYVDTVRSHAISLASGFTPVIHQSLDQANLIAVVAVGNRFTLYVNKVQIADTIDPNDTYTTGQIGLIADAVNVPTEAVFTNAQVWVLS